MALTINAQFIVSGVAVGNTLTGISSNTVGIVNDVVLTGNPGITVAQAQTAKLRIWAVDGDGGTAVSIYEINPPTITYTVSTSGAGIDMRGSIGSRNRRPPP